MSVRKVNALSCELDEPLDVAGFRHTATSIRQRIGAERIGAGLYEAVADHAIWPYHYHYPSEEWMYVISGAPVLRDAGGRRALRPGDVLCFPPNHVGAHTVSGPGRFIIFSTNESPGPWVCVYPDSDKISVSPGAHEAGALNALLLPRAGAVGYWFGEGSFEPAGPVPVQREPANATARPVANTLTMPLRDPRDDLPAGSRFRAASLGPALGGAELEATVVELDPGEGSEPYHYEYGREEWVLILAGTPTLRHPDGEEVLHVGDLVSFPEGPGGARRIINHGGQVVRAVLFSTQDLPANVCYPDTGTWTLRHSPDGPPVTLRETEGSDHQER